MLGCGAFSMLPATAPSVRAVYLHGFLSSAASAKGRFLQRTLTTPLQLLNLNGEAGPSSLTPHTALAAIEACWREREDEPLTLIGSSFGGWAASRFAMLYPDRVACLLLLNPGFNLGQRWDSIVGAAELAAWERNGVRTFEMPSTGAPVDVSWSFVEATRAEVGMPTVRAPTVVVHGRNDVVVPPALSEQFVREHAPLSTLLLLDDDHALTQPASLQRIAEEAERLCTRPEPP
jgi:hypothetical protein